ncbi:MAG TPA: hypothetical protein VH575_06620 [Gemmataceae bacterium]
MTRAHDAGRAAAYATLYEVNVCVTFEVRCRIGFSGSQRPSLGGCVTIRASTGCPAGARRALVLPSLRYR